MNSATIGRTLGLCLLFGSGSSMVAAQASLDSAHGACGQYLVFAPPLDSPDLGDRTLEVCPADGDASPFGWHDTDGLDGAEFTVTEGNNAIAREDMDGDNQGGFQPDGGPQLDFRFPLDLDLPPAESVAASITHAFYWINRLHDVRYAYGFDEVSGNFQQNNYGRGGAGGDPFTIEVLDPVGTGVVITPPDGAAPLRFELPEISPIANAVLAVTEPSMIAGDYEAAQGDWGGVLEPPIDGAIELTLDTAGTRLGCQPLIGFTPGNLALLFRGKCEFGTKALNAEDAGAAAAIIVNDEEALFAMGPGQVGNQVSIPALLIRLSDGATIRDELPEVAAELSEAPATARDGAFDNMVLAHGYGHGVSTRLTGGPNNSSCLNNAEQMGEGWSDFDALWFTADADDLPTDRRAYAAWSLFEPPMGNGARGFPYTTDLSVNPWTYNTIQGVSRPHGVGAVWAAMLWEVYWNLVDKHGFDPDLQNGSGGNQLAMQLVTDGMKLQPCSPSFVDARDAILSADLVATGGANACEIWRGFAKRGLGLSADAGSPNSELDGTESFDLPLECGPDLNAAGDCPGVVTLRASGLPPGPSTLITSSELGVSVVPAGPCAGTPLDLADPRRVAVASPQPDGTHTLERSLGPGRCGHFVQIVDSSCRVSPAVAVP